MGIPIQFDNHLVQFIIEHNLSSSVPYSMHKFLEFFFYVLSKDKITKYFCICKLTQS